jgi:putative peptidoglycan lipid II flippase
MGAATFLSRIMGLVREQVIAYFFGAGNATDAYQVAFRIPNLLRDLFAEGAMSAALVPTFTQTRTREGERRAWRVASLVFKVLFFFVLALSILGIYFSEELVDLFAHAYRSVPGKFEMTVLLTQIMYPFFPLVALAAAFMAVLNSLGYFFWPAFASALFNVASVIVAVLGALILPRYGIEPVMGLALGVVAGGAVQAFSQLPVLKRAGFRFVPKEANDPVWYRDPALKTMLVLMAPGMVGMAATQVNVLINSMLATGLGTGAVSWLGYAFRLMQFPIGIFGVSLAQATLPQVSRLRAQGDLAGISSQLNASLRTVFAVNLPATIGLIAVGLDLIRLLFEHGQFSMSDSFNTTKALIAYAVGLVAYSAVKVLVPVCYAFENTRVPVLSSVLSIVLAVTFNLLMVDHLGFWGLALGTSLAVFCNCAFLIVSIRRIIQKAGGDWKVGGALQAVLPYGGLSLVMGLVIWGSRELWIQNFDLPMTLVSKSGLLGILMLCGIGTAYGIARLFDLRELLEIFNLFTSRFKKKLS